MSDTGLQLRGGHDPELVRMQEFYADVARAGLPFATPVILRVEEIDGVAVTFERELHGKPLQKRLAFEDRELDPVGHRLGFPSAVGRGAASGGRRVPGRR